MEDKYNKLLDNIGWAIETGRNNALSLLNEQLLLTYWTIGRYIIESEQHGEKRATYGTELLARLSKDLKIKFGKGFSRSNLHLMRLSMSNIQNSRRLANLKFARCLAN